MLEPETEPKKLSDPDAWLLLQPNDATYGRDCLARGVRGLWTIKVVPGRAKHYVVRLDGNVMTRTENMAAAKLFAVEHDK
jgi:hypothetical protein